MKRIKRLFPKYLVPLSFCFSVQNLSYENELDLQRENEPAEGNTFSCEWYRAKTRSDGGKTQLRMAAYKNGSFFSLWNIFSCSQVSSLSGSYMTMPLS